MLGAFALTLALGAALTEASVVVCEPQPMIAAIITDERAPSGMPTTQRLERPFIDARRVKELE